MSKQRFPVLMDQPGATLYTFQIDGSEVGATSGTDGLNGRGKFLCNIKKSSNTVTIDWLVSFAEAPEVFFQSAAGQSDTIVDITTNSASQLVFDTVKATDGTAQADADLLVFVVGYNTTSFVS